MSFAQNAIISCAGIGSRLGLDKTKCLIEIEGETLLERQLDLLHSFEKVFVIVGFQYHKVIKKIESSKKYHNVIFVLNHEFRSTGNLYSINKLLKQIKQEPAITIDGDLLINENDFKRFLDQISCDPSKNIIGITKAKSEEAVFAQITENKVISFSFTNKSDYEWCGIAYVNSTALLIDDNKDCFVFEKFISCLPSNFFEFDCFEIDTPQDLILAERNFTSKTLKSL